MKISVQSYEGFCWYLNILLKIVDKFHLFPNLLCFLKYILEVVSK